MQRALLLILVAASYLLLAGARPWTLGPLLGIAGFAALSAWRHTFRFPDDHRRLDFALIAIAAVIAIQLIPLPVAIVDLLSPNASRIKAAATYSSLPTPAWAPLSIRPQLTQYSLAAVALGILSFWIARAVFSTPGTTRTFLRVLAVMGSVAAIAALIQRASASKLILFVVPAEERSAFPFGAFTNRNHFAAWLLLLSAPIIGYLIARLRIQDAHDRRWRSVVKRFLASGAVMTAMASVITLGTVVMTLSRSAVAGLGVAALTVWRFGRPRMRFERTNLPTRLGLVGVLLLLSVVFVDVDGWATRVEESLATETQFGRVTIWRETVPIIRDFWLTGTGAGTYSDAMQYYQQTRVWVSSMQRWAHFNNAHSHYIQIATEGGLLLLIPSLFALAALWTLARRTLRADKGEMFWVRVGAAAGLAGLAAQSIWEVSLTTPANAVLCGVLGGLLLYRREASRSDPAQGASRQNHRAESELTGC